MQCPKCNSVNSDNSKKCSNCDFDFSNISSDETVAATTPLGSGPHDIKKSVESESTNDDSDLTGAILGDYKVTGFIGKGGMGTVYSGIHPIIGKKVAFKLLNKELSDNKKMLGRFLAEAKAVNAIEHPNIIDIITFGKYKGQQFFVMEYLVGQTLSGYLEKHIVMDYKTAYSIFRQLLDALKASHEKGIIHRDLKPDNIFLEDRSFNHEYVKILDFGIAKFTEDGFKTSNTKSGVPIGTPYYMSPEQCAGKNVDHRTDIYALGIIMYELFTGRKPFEADSFMAVLTAHILQAPVNPSELAEIDPELENIILWCLKKEKENRPSDIGELEKSLIPILKRLSDTDSAPLPNSSARSVNIPELTISDSGIKRKPSTNPSKIYLKIIGLVVISIVAGVSYFGKFGSEKKSTKDSNTAVNTTSVLNDKPTLKKHDVKEKLQKQTIVEKLKIPGSSVMSIKKHDSINIQLTGIPDNVKHSIMLNHKIINKSLIKLKKSTKEKVLIEVIAKGYKLWKREFYPLTDGTFDVNLVKLSVQNKNHKTRIRRTMKKSPMKSKSDFLNII